MCQFVSNFTPFYIYFDKTPINVDWKPSPEGYNEHVVIIGKIAQLQKDRKFYKI